MKYFFLNSIFNKFDNSKKKNDGGNGNNENAGNGEDNFPTGPSLSAPSIEKPVDDADDAKIDEIKRAEERKKLEQLARELNLDLELLMQNWEIARSTGMDIEDLIASERYVTEHPWRPSKKREPETEIIKERDATIKPWQPSWENEVKKVKEHENDDMER